MKPYIDIADNTKANAMNKFDLYCRDILCQCKHLIYTPINLCDFQHTLQILVNFQSHKTDAYVGFYTFACKMEHRAYLYL